jgi:hypothetical protein
MVKHSRFSVNAILTIIVVVVLFSARCKKEENHVKYSQGTFPDTVINLAGLNSPYDDYNSTSYEITDEVPLIFSSNRKSEGGQFDLEQGLIAFSFDKTNGSLEISTGMTQDAFASSLISKAVTPGNDFGPYQVYSSFDGMEYFILASENDQGNLDLRYLMNLPQYGSALPDIHGPYPVTFLNTDYDDAYLSFNRSLDSAYFCSNIDGNFDIYVKTRTEGIAISSWFNSAYSPAVKVDNINSPANDKCPMIYHRLLVFVSDRPGGYGGYDLYYSRFENGNWGEPVNFGPSINTEYNEYRPLIGYHSEFTNIYMIFSSDRPGGTGGFDLYFTGIEYQ